VNNTLPVYSENGDDVAGALINDTVWISRARNCLFCYHFSFFISTDVKGDSTTFLFNGSYSPYSIKFTDTGRTIQTSLYAVVKGLKIENQDSLLKLNNRSFLLDGVKNYSGISKYAGYEDHKGSGSFTINKVQKGSWIIGDGTANNPTIYSFIVSGHFDFNIHDDRDYIIKNGRFDMFVNWNGNFSIN
jgi:hypothetical protein